MNRKVILFSSIVLFYLGCSGVYNLSQPHSPSVVLKKPQPLCNQAAQAAVMLLLDGIHNQPKHAWLWLGLSALCEHKNWVGWWLRIADLREHKQWSWWCLRIAGLGEQKNSRAGSPLHQLVRGHFQLYEKAFEKLEHIPPRLHRKCTEDFIDYHRESLNLLDDQGWAPLHIAVLNNDKQAVLYLLYHDAINVDIWSSNGYTPLHLAVENGYVAIAKLLLEYRANVNEPCRHYFLSMFTPLHLATMLCDVKRAKEMISLLLKHGANANAEDSFGRIPSSIESTLRKKFMNYFTKLAAAIM